MDGIVAQAPQAPAGPGVTRAGGRIGIAVLAVLILGFPIRALQASQALPVGDEMLPPSGALAGWVLVEDPLRFPGEDLWKHINGAAEQYLSFGCTTLTAAYYSREGSESEIAVEIYRMKDELGSFGLYTLERPPEGPFLKIGAQGYQVGGDLNLFGGAYYVKLRAYPVEEAELEAERELAGIIAGKHLAGSTFPKALGYFPRDSLVMNSLGLVPKSVLGLKGLRNAFAARYRSNGDEMVLHWVREKNLDIADSTFSIVQESLRKRSIVPLSQTNIDSGQGVSAEMKYHGRVVLLRSGKDVLLAVGALDQDWAYKSISRFLTNLTH